ncbi:nitrous oxide reductase accessory protein NosL [Wolinella succinogenes]|uniref:nitrous oxide reductase accessory protein NosL n=1 Tax=Wolinella succinogenes TaxID=844 RepID=UPI00030BC95F|nr:nitrous oxide reductase accessory protein NosL [Wolinella succinogenes]VEG81358.1 NosL [Wolinella succinogenes]HCZ17980.1 hypothetical protein [Helicobacter sp.]
MKKALFWMFGALLAMLWAAPPAMFQSVSKEEATLLQKGPEAQYCPNCGMDLVKFYKTNHAVKLKDGEVRQYCSLHCLIEEQGSGYLKDKQGLIDQILVVDVESLKFIPAQEAFYVVGSQKPGTMTMTSQYAFKNRTKAEAFAKENGGEVMDYKSAYAVGEAEFAKDIAMIKNKRETGMYPKGEKLYNESCDKSRLEKLHVHTIAEFKAMVKNSDICGKDLDDSSLQAISLFVWDKKLAKANHSH